MQYDAVGIMFVLIEILCPDVTIVFLLVNSFIVGSRVEVMVCVRNIVIGCR